MFDAISSRFDEIFTRLRGHGRLSDEDIAEVLARSGSPCSTPTSTSTSSAELIERIRERATGAELAKSLTPAQQVIKIVNEELTAILGGESLKHHLLL